MAESFFPDVVVNGCRIPHAAIAAEAQNHEAPRTKPGWAWRKAARALTVRALLLEEAARRGLDAIPRQLGDGLREDGDEALIRVLLEASVASEAPSEKQLRAFYDAAPARFRAPTLYEAAHILFAAPEGDEAARNTARARATEALAALMKGDVSFEALAQAESACGSSASGGRLGQFCAGDRAPEFEAALDRLKPGAFAREPVETAFGVHIVRLDARAEGETPPFEMVRERIRLALEKQAWTRGARDLVAELVARADLRGVEFDAALG
ncbi:MAG: peptidylprolyl isomerase [Neomegalonema sp.]|nr:peptidylprolyl isomerase [Neomegalonema sp.]